jgi:hypothetical protein
MLILAILSGLGVGFIIGQEYSIRRFLRNPETGIIEPSVPVTRVNKDSGTGSVISFKNYKEDDDE